MFLLLVITGCKNDPCGDIDINRKYDYPIEEAKGKSREERIKMFKIPDNVLHCISTEPLIKTCLDHPDMVLMWIMSDLQGGFDLVEKLCNGYEELWKRGDRCQKLINLYQPIKFNRDWSLSTDLENGLYIDNIMRYELIIAQYEVLRYLTNAEKIELFQLVIDNQKSKQDQIEYFNYTGMQTSCAILSRIMFIDQYQPIIDEYNNNELMFLHIDYMLILDSDIVTKVMELSEKYIEILKNKQNENK